MATYQKYDWKEKDPTGQPIPPRQTVAIVSNTDGRLTERMLNGVAYLVGNSVIPRLTYPGTMAPMLNKFSKIIPARWVLPPLQKQAAWLISQMKAKRYRLKTRTGNTIDSMLVDRREKPKFPLGNILVIACEGNYTFYEDGVSEIPLKLGYSVLMWNHPGYGDSAGYPSPAEEEAAIDVVVQFAIFGCGWNESDIAVYGWSIGGYTASWAAMNYPNIRGVILDATFDDLLQLAQKWVPTSLHSLMVRAIRTHWNLDIGQQLVRYKGPVLLVRRAADDLMSMDKTNVAAMRKTNRINSLLKRLMENRYPGVFGTDDETVEAVINKWLEGDDTRRESICKAYEIDKAEWILQALLEHVQNVAILNYYEIKTDVLPASIGYEYDSIGRRQMALFLVSKCFTEVNTDHYRLLNFAKFVLPSQPWGEGFWSKEEEEENAVESTTVTPSSSSSSEKSDTVEANE